MFSPVPMVWLRAVILDRDERNVLRSLGELGALHIASARNGLGEPLVAPPDRSAQRRRCRRIRDRVADLRRELSFSSAEVRIEAFDGSLSLERAEALLDTLQQRAAQLRQRQEAATKQLSSATAMVEQLTSFKDIDLPFDKLSSFSFLHFAVGSLPAAAMEDLREKVGDNVLLIPLPRRAERDVLVAVTSRTGRFALETALQQSRFKHEEISAGDGHGLSAMLLAGKREHERLEDELRQIELARQGLSLTSAPQLLAIDTFADNEERMLIAEESFPHTDATVMISGWVPSNELETVTQRLREITRGVCALETRNADELPNNQVPVLLRHPRLLRPFQMLVAGYGTPGYRELEPTLFVAITYMLMFGMMFGDIGHGAVLALGGLLALLRGGKVKVRDMGVLLLMAGISSIGFGLLYGSFFGLRAFHKYALWRDPLDGNPIDLMLLAVALGVVVISIGIILNVINRFRKRDWLGGLFDGFGVVGALFYWGMLGLLLKFAVLRAHGLVTAALVLVVALPLIAWILREPLKVALARRGGGAGEAAHGGYLAAVMKATVEAFETILSYMANTISFVRLAAYAMSHAAVLMATFVMADAVREMGSSGSFLSYIVIVGGNLVAIVLEGIIAAVQALRLEYYEFFGKFFRGDGLPFSPFRLKESE